VGTLTGWGIPDPIANIPTMWPTYLFAVRKEIMFSFSRLLGNSLSGPSCDDKPNDKPTNQCQ